MILCVAGYWKDRRRAKNNKCCQGVRHRSQPHVVSRLWKSFKTTGMCSRRHGGDRDSRSPRKTVARRLRGRGLYACRPVVCVSLTRQHHAARLQWCREHHNWTEQDWACVLFSNESRFSLSSDCRRQLIWRESGTAYRQKNPGKGPISDMQYHGVGRHHDQWPHALNVVANGTMTGQRYIEESSTSSCFVFSVVLSVINLILWTTTQHVIEDSLFMIV
ncbi:transposable element Tcb2 transposase [Trichonephila clavipes]|nr:transposable element Tcb2 transposase [Trichonephila clavipes]